MRPAAPAALAALLALTPPPTLIVNARVIDGSGAPARAAAVRIEAGRIAAIGDLAPRPGETIVDAHGLVLAPGFIDTHSHADDDLFDHPDAVAATSQGITTVVVGQDGGSSHPLADFFARLEKEPAAVNVASYAGHGTIRALVMGDDFRRAAGRREVRRMERRLADDMRAGALGLSTGLEYDPGIYSARPEVVALAKVAAAHGGRYISHVRSEDRYFWDAIDEIVAIGREARLVVDEIVPPDGLLLTQYDPEPEWAGRTLAAIAALRGEEPAVTLMELLRRAEVRRRETGDAGESIIGTSMTEADLERLLAWPHTNICTDGALDGAHPRGYGTYPRILGRYVRDRRVLTLEEAVRRMTGLAAAHVGIGDRGLVRAGMAADLVLFDPATIADRATTEAPHALADGIERVWVGGEVVFADGRAAAARPGRVLRRTPSASAMALTDRTMAAR